MQGSKKDPVNVIYTHGHKFTCQAHPNRGQHGVVLAMIMIHWNVCDFKKGIITEWMF